MSVSEVQKYRPLLIFLIMVAFLSMFSVLVLIEQGPSIELYLASTILISSLVLTLLIVVKIRHYYKNKM